MAQTPSVDDLAARLADLEKRIAETERRTLSTLTVTDGSTQVKTFQIDKDTANSNRSRLQLRDSAGDVVVGSDTGGAGWGLLAPVTTAAPACVISWPDVQNLSTSYSGAFSITMPVLSQRVHVYTSCEMNATGSKTGTFQVQWQLASGGSPTVMDTHPITASGLNFADYDFVYTWPSNLYNQVVQLIFYSKISAAGGSDYTAYMPQTAINIPAA
jgi:hypothetical protein